MTKLALIPVVLLACLLGACGPAFTSSELTTGLGEAGEAPQAVAGAAGAGEAAAGAVGQAGAPSTAGAGGGGTSGAGFGGALSQTAGAAGAGTSAGGSGGAPVLAPPPCAHAADTVSPGYLALGGPGCYRTKETFDTIYCLGPGWPERAIKVNGVLAECNKTQAFAPLINGYNYFELLGPGGGSDRLIWITASEGMSCWQPFHQDQCADYQVDNDVTYNGHNYLCATQDCGKSCKDPAYLPGGSANAWSDEGACQ